MLGSHQGRCNSRKGLGTVGMLGRGKRRLELKLLRTNLCAHGSVILYPSHHRNIATELPPLPSQEHKGIPPGFFLETGSHGISGGCEKGMGRTPTKQHPNKCLEQPYGSRISLESLTAKADGSLTLGAAQEQAQTTDQPSHSAGNPLCVSFHLASVQTGSKQKFLKASSKLEPAKLAMAPSCPVRARSLLNSLL